jgi:hypothetical protein
MFISLMLLLFTFVLPYNPTHAQSDDILITIPSKAALEATHLAPNPIRFYHRLGDAYLAGTSRATFMQLHKHGMQVLIIDEQPWTSSYAVVALHPGKPVGSLERLSVRVVYIGDDYRLVKGSAELFQQLRDQGFVCVEIEHREIPIEEGTTRLPESIGHQTYGFVDSVIAFVSDTSIRNYIQAMQNFGTRYWNNANRDSVSRWVRAKYLEAGYTDVRLDSFQYSSTWQANVVATTRGTVDSTRELIVGGHHDSYNSANQNLAPGADDNASGASAALEMARVLKLINYRPAYTMRFMGFAAEEAGLRGSASYAQRARTANRDIRCMQNYDMIANRYQAPTDQSVYVVWYTTSEAYRDLHSRMMQMYTPLVPVATTSYRSGSDSYSFWQQNYRAVFCIEKNFSPYYHSQNDLLQYLDMTYAANIVKSGLAMLLTLDQMPPTVERLRVRDCGDGTSLFVSWDSTTAPDFAAYKIYVGRIPGVYDTIYTQTARSREIEGLTEGTSYIVGVSVVDLVGREGIITELTGIPRSVPLRPAGLVSIVVPGQGVRLQWRQNQEMDLRGYNLYRWASYNPTFQRLNTSPIVDTTYLDTPANGTLRYYVTALDSTAHESLPSDTIVVVVSEVQAEASISPFQFALFQNYPNPFNPSTQLKYEIGSRGNVELKVFDVLGREVATLVNEVKSSGVYVAPFDASGLASGVYYARLKAEGRVATVRITLVR